MWTTNNKKYYDIIRSHESKRHENRTLSETQQTAARQGPAASSLQRTCGAPKSAIGVAITNPSPADDVDGGYVDPSVEKAKLFDPISALRLPATAVHTVKELTFCKKGITALHPNFLLLENLEVLILQHNCLATVNNLLPPSRAVHLRAEQPVSEAESCVATRKLPMSAGRAGAGAPDDSNFKLYGPRGCVRLRQLFLSHNNLTDLDDTDIPRLALLEHLYLANNRLTNLARVVQQLKRLRWLTTLDLRGNPISDEPGYRAYVLFHLKLNVLDRQTVSSEERSEAAAQYAAAAQRDRRDRALLVSGGRASCNDAATDEISHSRNSCVMSTPAARLHSNGHVAETLSPQVAFGSSFVPPSNKCKSQRLWDKSKCVKMMEKRSTAILREQQQVREEEEKAKQLSAEALVQQRAAFHTVWALSRGGMPLSEENLKDHHMFPSSGSTEGNVKPSVEDALPSKIKRQPAGAVAAKKQNSSAVATASSLPEMHTLREQLLPLLPVDPRAGTSGQDGIQSRPSKKSSVRVTDEGGNGTTKEVEEVSQNQSILFDALLGRTESVRERTVKADDRWALNMIPIPGRLKELNSLLHFSEQVFSEPSQEESKKGSTTSCQRTISTNMETRQSRLPDLGASAASTALVPGGVSAATIPAPDARAVLGGIRAHRSAMIPPPWEHNAHESRVKLRAEEVEDYLVQMVWLHFLPQELQRLERTLGSCALLKVLGQSGAGGLGSAHVTASFTPTSGKPSTSSRRGRTNSTQRVSLTSLPDQPLLRLMTTPVYYSGMRVVRTSFAGSSYDGSSNAPVLSSPGTASSQGGSGPYGHSTSACALTAGALGRYDTGTVAVLMGLLEKESGAWEMDVGKLLNAVAAAHGVNLSTDVNELPRAGSHATVDSSPTPCDRVLLNSDADTKEAVSIDNGKKCKRPLGKTKNALAGKNGNRGATGGIGNPAGLGEVPGFLTSPVASEASSSTIPLLSLDNMLPSLICYIPFVQRRVCYFQAKCRDCVSQHRGDAQDATAKIWFARSQQAQTHLQKLMNDFEHTYACSTDPEEVVLEPSVLAEHAVVTAGSFWDTTSEGGVGHG